MNYLPFILAAYIVAFVLIGIMFGKSYGRYKKVKRAYFASRPVAEDAAKPDEGN